jgi:hypothetical protein
MYMFGANNFASVTGVVSSNVATLPLTGTVNLLLMRSAFADVSATGNVIATTAPACNCPPPPTPPPTHQPPTIDPIPDLFIPVNSPPQTVPLTGISADELSDVITITATSPNFFVVSFISVNYTSPDTTGTLTIGIAFAIFGNASIIVTVNDNDGGVTTIVFFVNVLPPNGPPTINPIPPPEAIPVNSGQQTILLSGIGPGLGNSYPVTVTATSDNLGLIPNPTVSYGGFSSTGSISYTPLPGQSGSALITVTVTGTGGSTSVSFTQIVSP